MGRCSSRRASPSAMSTSPCPGFMRRNLTGRLCQSPPSFPAGRRAHSEDVDRPGRPAVRAARDRLGGRALGARARRRPGRRRAPDARRASTSAAPRAVSGAVGEALAGISTIRSTVEQHVGDPGLAMTAGDDDGGRAQGVDGARQISDIKSGSRRPAPAPPAGSGSRRSPGEHEADERVLGVDTAARPDSAHHHRVNNEVGVPAGRKCQRAPDGLRAGHGPEHADLHSVHADVSRRRRGPAQRPVAGETAFDAQDPDRVLRGHGGD